MIGIMKWSGDNSTLNCEATTGTCKEISQLEDRSKGREYTGWRVKILLYLAFTFQLSKISITI